MRIRSEKKNSVATARSFQVYRHSRAEAPGRGIHEAVVRHSRDIRVQNKVFRNRAIRNKMKREKPATHPWKRLGRNGQRVLLAA